MKTSSQTFYVCGFGIGVPLVSILFSSVNACLVSGCCGDMWSYFILPSIHFSIRVCCEVHVPGEEQLSLSFYDEQQKKENLGRVSVVCLWLVICFFFVCRDDRVVSFTLFHLRRFVGRGSKLPSPEEPYRGAHWHMMGDMRMFLDSGGTRTCCLVNKGGRNMCSACFLVAR